MRWPPPCEVVRAADVGYDELLRARARGRVTVRFTDAQRMLVCDVDGARMSPEAVVELGRRWCG